MIPWRLAALAILACLTLGPIADAAIEWRLSETGRRYGSSNIAPSPLAPVAPSPHWGVYPPRDLTQRALASLPPAPLDGAFSFVVLGDNRGNYEVLRELIQMANRRQPSFLINTGDLVAKGKLSEYLRFLAVVRQSHSPCFMVAGNHDIGGNGRMLFRRIFGEENYAFDYSGCRFIILDNADGSFPDERLAWLEQQLATPLRKFLFLHKPPAVGNWAHPFDASPWTHNADRFTDLMSRRSVDRVFLGHIHAYEEKEIGGVRYVVTGGAGAPLDPAPHAYFHFVLVTVTKGGIQERVIRLRPL
jgi:predicted phosphodiesterase